MEKKNKVGSRDSDTIANDSIQCNDRNFRVENRLLFFGISTFMRVKAR